MARLQSFSEKHPSIPFIHAHPGLVRTNLVANSPSTLIRASSFLTRILTRLIAITPDECAEYMWNSIYTTVGNKPGAWRTGWKGEDLGKKRYYGDGEKRRKLWEHTSAVVEVALGRSTDSATYMN